MRIPWTTISSRVMIVVIAAFTLFGCVTNPNAPPEPGSELWYTQRMQEIEAAKAEGHLTPEQYLSLKNEADATRAARINASRYSDSSNYWFENYH